MTAAISPGSLREWFTVSQLAAVRRVSRTTALRWVASIRAKAPEHVRKDGRELLVAADGLRQHLGVEQVETRAERETRMLRKELDEAQQRIDAVVMELAALRAWQKVIDRERGKAPRPR